MGSVAADHRRAADATSWTTRRKLLPGPRGEFSQARLRLGAHFRVRRVWPGIL